MKTKHILTLTLVVLLAVMSHMDTLAGNKKIRFVVSEPDAKVFVDGKMMGTGQLDIIVPGYACIIVRVEKVGYLTEVIEFCNKPDFAPPPKNYSLLMQKDDAYDASEATDVANIDLEVRTNKSEIDAWKLLSQIITSYFDVIEVTDRETGYLRTAWTVQTFKKNTIRTRMIVKLGSSDPLTYKIKLVSEESQKPQTSVKSDELFREWDRVLRKYKEVVFEVQSRLTN
jgi:hypothetical protein